MTAMVQQLTRNRADSDVVLAMSMLPTSYASAVTILLNLSDLVVG